MGHALHSYFTWQKQPYLYSGHKIFVAEVASTCNEALLMHYLLENTQDITMKNILSITLWNNSEVHFSDKQCLLNLKKSPTI